MALEFASTPASLDQAIDESFDAVRESIRVQTRELGEVNLPLSGGYDSRLTLAIASQFPSLKLNVSTLKTRPYETQIAEQVAQAIGIPLQLIPGKKRILDLFDDPFSLTPCGFITGRNLTSMIARLHPGLPLLSGYIGDGVMRGSMLPAGNAFFARDAENQGPDDFVQAFDKRYTMHAHRLALLADPIKRRVGERALAAIRNVAIKAIASTRPAIYGDLFCRHRFYFANILLQHVDVTEGIPAFCNFRSLNCRVKYHHSCFGADNYPRLFERYFPPLAKISHSYYLSPRAKNTPRPLTPPTRHLRRWSADLAAGLLLTDVLQGAKKRKIFTLLPAGLVGETTYQDEITFLYKLMTFERTLLKHGIDFDWEKM